MDFKKAFIVSIAAPEYIKMPLVSIVATSLKLPAISLWVYS
jgi:hypothetical protein